ncbi:zinc finger protein RFP-like isoform X2 [Tiliqua scincoides]|uniref:zinc finger protein RFP-like isoform X2 n=1 Tax=Tiliqua scincoides TaxID=71010 RepID=UPI0034627A68
MAAGSCFVEEFGEETTCPICMDYFTDPVILDCGHNFCRACLARFWGDSGKAASCPHCRAPARQRHFQPNRQLANIVEITKKYSLQVARWAETLCETHQEPLKLFCREDEAPICVVCDRSKEHHGHKVVPMEEAAQEYKEEIQARLQFVKKEREMIVDQKLLEEKRSQMCLAQLKVEQQNVSCAFEKMQAFLKEKKLLWLSQLGELEKEIEKRQEQNITRFSEEISSFNNLITEMEMTCQQPATEFLKDIRSTLTRCQKRRAKQLIPLSPELEERLRSFSSLISVHKKALEKCEDVVGSSGEWTPICDSAPVPEPPGRGLTKAPDTVSER